MFKIRLTARGIRRKEEPWLSCAAIVQAGRGSTRSETSAGTAPTSRAASVRPTAAERRTNTWMRKQRAQLNTTTAWHACFVHFTFCRRWFLALNSSSSLISCRGNVEVKGYSNRQRLRLEFNFNWCSSLCLLRYLVDFLQLLYCGRLRLDWGERSENDENSFISALQLIING